MSCRYFIPCIVASLCVLTASGPVHAADAPTPKVEEQLIPDDPAVGAILSIEPTTPAECLRAANSLATLGHPKMARQFIKKVLDAKLKPEQLTALSEEFGASVFLNLAAKKDLLPEAKQLADAVTAAMAAKLKDVDRIKGLIKQLQDASADVRGQAMLQLQTARDAAVGLLLGVLADPARGEEYANVRTVLAGLGRPAREQLIAVLDGADPKLQVQAILTLGEMNRPEVAVELLGACLKESGGAEVRAAAAAVVKRLTGSVPNRAEAARQLSELAQAHVSRKQPFEGVVDNRVVLQRWDPAKRQCVAMPCTLDDASRLMAAHFAHEAHRLVPDDRAIGLLAATAALEAVGCGGNNDLPTLDDKWSSVEAFEEILEDAMRRGQMRAAALAASMLGEKGKAEDLLYRGDKPATLVRAVQQPDRRLRIAALEAIVRLKPTKPFAGSSYVPSALAFFAGSSGVRHAIVAGPNSSRIRDLVGLLTAAGFEVDAVTNGHDFLRLATRSPDYELALIDVSISRPDAGALLQELRRDARTGDLHVGLIARDGYLKQANRLADGDRLSKAFARPQDDQAMRWQLDQLAMLAPQAAVDFKTRQKQADIALDLLAELCRTSRKLCDWRRVEPAVLVALHSPTRSLKAIAILATMNSAESQTALVDLASRLGQPIGVRQVAAKAFCRNAEEHGVLLTTEQIRSQYQRYNESEKQDAATQKVLGNILDVLEAGIRGRGEKDTEQKDKVAK